MFYTLDEIISNTNAFFFYKNGDDCLSRKYKLSILLEDIDENTIFIPRRQSMNGKLVDTYKSLMELAIQRGCKGIFFEKDIYKESEYFKLLNSVIQANRKTLEFVLMIDSRDKMMTDLAFYTRCNKISSKTKIVSVTGSVGKTSTTGMLYSILSQSHCVFAKEFYANIKLRVTHRFFELEENTDYDYIIFECSGGCKGYLKTFSEFLLPDYAVITKIGTENIGTFKTIENIAKEKSTLLSGMTESSIAVVDDTQLLRKCTANYCTQKIFIKDDDYSLIETNKNGSKFIYKGEEYEIPVVGIHQISNAIKAIELTFKMGINIEDIKNGLKYFKQVGERWIIDNFGNDVIFVSDSANMSYEALVSNVNTFLHNYKDIPNKRFAFNRSISLGAFESEIYLKIADFLSDKDFSEIILVGEELQVVYDCMVQNCRAKVKIFPNPKAINRNDEFIRYIFETINNPQAFLFKISSLATFDISIADFLRKNLK